MFLVYKYLNFIFGFELIYVIQCADINTIVKTKVSS